MLHLQTARSGRRWALFGRFLRSLRFSLVLHILSHSQLESSGEPSSANADLAADTHAAHVKRLLFHLVIDQPEPGSHVFVQDPVYDPGKDVSFALHFRIASPHSGTGYGRGAGYCCRRMDLKVEMGRTEALVHERPYWYFPSRDVCTSQLFTLSLEQNDESVWTTWGSGTHVFSVELHDPQTKEILASNRSIFHIHLTYDFDYSSLRGLQGKDLFRTASAVVHSELADSSKHLLIESSLFHRVPASQLKVVTRDRYTSPRALSVYVLCQLAGNKPGSSSTPECGGAATLLSDATLFPFSVDVIAMLVDVPLSLWRGRPQTDTDFEAEEEYLSDYMSFHKAWSHFAEADSNLSADNDWAVFLRADAVLHPSHNTSADPDSSAGHWLGEVLSELIALAEEDGFGFLGLCGHLLNKHHLRVPDADRALPHNFTSASASYARGTGPFPVAFVMTRAAARTKHWWSLAGRDVHRSGGTWLAGVDLPDVTDGACAGVFVPAQYRTDTDRTRLADPDPRQRSARSHLRNMPASSGAARTSKVALCLFGHPRHFRFADLGMADALLRNVVWAFFPEADSRIFAQPVLSGMETVDTFDSMINYTRPIPHHAVLESLDRLRPVRVKFVHDRCEEDACTPRQLRCGGRLHGNLDRLTFQMSRWKACGEAISEYEASHDLLFDWAWTIRYRLISARDATRRGFCLCSCCCRQQKPVVAGFCLCSCCSTVYTVQRSPKTGRASSDDKHEHPARGVVVAGWTSSSTARLHTYRRWTQA
jgi:hypothetical protein